MKASELIGPQPSTCVFEARYENAFSIWDRAGETWQKVCAKYPSAKLESADPRAVKFRLDDFELLIEISRVALVSNGSLKDLKRFSEIATTLIEAAVTTLKIPSFSRLGLRVTYWNPSKSAEEAAHTFKSLGLTLIPGTAPLGKEAKLLHPEWVARWETETQGIIIAFRSQVRKYEIDVPPQIRDDVDTSKLPRETPGLLVDVDHFTRGIVSKDLFVPSIWIEQSQASIRRALKGFLGVHE